MPAIRRVLETALYVGDLERATAFYRDTLGLEVMTGSDRFTALDAGEGSVLLLFIRGETTEGLDTGAGVIPPHDSRGPAHFAFAIDSAELEPWRAALDEAGLEIESEVDWPAGGTSLYFRDPDEHLVELATPGIWPVY